MPVSNPSPVGATILYATGGSVFSTTFTNIAGLTFSIAAGEIVYFDAYIYYTSSATTNGIGLSVNGPAGAAAQYDLALQAVANSTTGNNTMNTGFFTWRAEANFDSMNATSTVPSATDVLRGRLVGYVTAGITAGTVAMRVRTENGTPAFVSINANSRLLYWRR